MSEKRRLLEELIAKLKLQRDELAVQMHLGKAEAKEQWDQLQQQWDQLNDEYEPLKDAVGETADGVWAGVELIAGELKSGFDRVSQTLKKKSDEEDASD